MPENPSNLRRKRSRLDADSLWRERVGAAEEVYNRARTEADQALKACDCTATSVQIQFLRQAQERETAALDEFMGVLQIFHDMVVAGKRKDSESFD